MERKQFLIQSAFSGAALILNPLRSLSQQAGIDPIPLSAVKDFVGAGHNNLDKVKQLLLEFPNLIYASYDLGSGDFEQAIEGAGHVGAREIAEYLIQQGARPNIFVMTMLGETTIVKAIIEKYPELLNSRGAHGFTLLHHAARGGEPAKELLDYLASRGLKEMRIKIM